MQNWILIFSRLFFFFSFAFLIYGRFNQFDYRFWFVTVRNWCLMLDAICCIYRQHKLTKSLLYNKFYSRFHFQSHSENRFCLTISCVSHGWVHHNHELKIEKEKILINIIFFIDTLTVDYTWFCKCNEWIMCWWPLTWSIRWRISS